MAIRKYVYEWLWLATVDKKPMLPNAKGMENDVLYLLTDLSSPWTFLCDDHSVLNKHSASLIHIFSGLSGLESKVWPEPGIPRVFNSTASRLHNSLRDSTAKRLGTVRATLQA
jgi:hypothetical protein